MGGGWVGGWGVCRVEVVATIIALHCCCCSCSTPFKRCQHESTEAAAGPKCLFIAFITFLLPFLEKIPPS